MPFVAHLKVVAGAILNRIRIWLMIAGIGCDFWGLVLRFWAVGLSSRLGLDCGLDYKRSRKKLFANILLNLEGMVSDNFWRA